MTDQHIQNENENQHETEKHTLSHNWVVWFHQMHNNNWGIESYKKVYTFSTIEDFWGVYNTLTPFLRKGLFFIMKEGISPTWEDTQNIKGCTVSLVSDEQLTKWKELCIGLISNNLIANDNDINGVSICPKKGSYLLKMWMVNCVDPNVTKEYQLDLRRSQKKIHKENM